MIIYKKLNTLVPYENNPRNNKKGVDAVAASIRDFGFKVPVIIDKWNVIVAGHTRVLAAKKLGLVEVPCIVADDLDEEQLRAFRLIDNQVATFAQWDEEKLDLELEKIGIDMSEYGFTIGRALKNSSEEINVADFDDENFDTECPYCGFRFNRE